MTISLTTRRPAAGTLRNTSVVYTKGSSRVSAKLGSLNAVEVCPAAWFPLLTNFTAFDGNPTGGAHCASGVSVNLSGDTLTFAGITAIADSDTTADYAFGYADVTPNGSPDQYGDAVNPYTPYTSDKTGGDGFDLEWAVDISTGLPVDVTGKTFHYVRVYSAVLDFGRFGETSAEITGIFTTKNKATTSVGQTVPTSLTINGVDINLFGSPVSYGNVKLYDLSLVGITSGTLQATLAGANIYMNGTNTDTLDVVAGTNYVRVIVQSGTAAPYIALVKFA